MTRFRRAARWLLPLLLLAGCAGELNTPGEALRLLGGSLEDAFLGERYEASLRPAGGLRPYEFELGDGELPAGLELDNGVIRGTPTELGNFTFTVNVTDANLSSTFLEHRLRVVELPDPELDIVMPETETRTAFTVRVGVAEARELRGLSTRLRWDPARFRYVEGSLDQSGEGTVIFSSGESDWLQVDLALRGSTFTGERQLFSFRLEPLEPARPGLEARTVFETTATEGSTYSQVNAGARVPQAARPAQEEPDRVPAETEDDAAPAPEQPQEEQ